MTNKLSNIFEQEEVVKPATPKRCPPSPITPRKMERIAYRASVQRAISKERAVARQKLRNYLNKEKRAKALQERIEDFKINGPGKTLLDRKWSEDEFRTKKWNLLVTDKVTDQVIIANVIMAYIRYRGFHEPWSTGPFDPTIDYWNEFRSQHDQDFKIFGTNPCMKFRLKFEINDNVPEFYRSLFLDDCEPEGRYPSAVSPGFRRINNID